MTTPPDAPRKEVTLAQLLPNMLTVAAICAGITAIRLGVQGDFVRAVQLLLIAGVLDGLDGRLARLLRSSSAMGAELDSLADFLNFGVAAPLVVYYWGLQDVSRQAGWIAVLFFAVCCVMRLARFNVSAKSDDTKGGSGAYFEGLPSPAGALLAMLPMFMTFAIPGMSTPPAPLIGLYMAGVGLLMISPVPVWSFKKTKISRENVKFFLLGFACAAAALVIFTWTALIVMCLAYVGMVIWAALVWYPNEG
ncbi:CDP-alcohol phosphatidyltransferase [Roseovarius gaetbuli]|uniref:CDP-alcohol phosphatidyltransferase n=1 Tax=Roseovarius gaetbuli TaxID=1356575 RepID=A0A1X6ZIK1_9RHOB|nr:phosphatidylcholine/phosphatidylserine synthase [Roseovarius gaetbuli]SLN52756.1 CDP-alcohol phosphatidyltransferase [Roseovarius gaetbuli]